jgi:hypothetical protein
MKRSAKTVRAAKALKQAMGWQDKAETLSWAQRHDILDALSLLLDQLYVHLPLKRALYGFDVLRALRKLKQDSMAMSGFEFHRELTLTLSRLRDAHTSYQGPWKQKGIVASLPFLIESSGPLENPDYVVSKTYRAGIKDKNFVVAVKVTHWNGILIKRAVELHGETQTGGRMDSRRARALETLTFRSLEFMPPPDEDWVDVRYVDLKGKVRETRFKWEGLEPGPSPLAVDGGGRSVVTRFAQSLYPAAEAVRRAKKYLFSTKRWEEERGKTRNNAASAMADAVTARVVKTKHGDFGYLRIWGFSVGDDKAFVNAVARMLKRLPDRGLIIDIRSNPGGYIIACERLLQLFTSNRISPVKFALRATALAAEMAQSDFNQEDLGDWSESLDLAQRTGEAYSTHIAITSEEECNDIGQHYGGPVLLVADANTYSCGDLFAAGFVDNGLGPLIVIGEATGAGGANVWGLDDLRAALSQTQTTLPRLPEGVDFSMSIRRAVRSGQSDGSLIEDLGVAGQSYIMTERDVLDGNQDLLDYCGGILASQPSTRLSASWARGKLTLTTKGLETLVISVDGLPWSAPIAVKKDGKTVIAPKLGRGQVIDIEGRANGNVLQRRRLFA